MGCHENNPRDLMSCCGDEQVLSPSTSNFLPAGGFLRLEVLTQQLGLLRFHLLHKASISEFILSS